MALQAIPEADKKRKDIALFANDDLAQMRLSQGKFRETIEISNQTLKSAPDISTDEVADLTLATALAEGRIGQLKPARLHADKLLTLGKQNSDEGVVAQAELVGAEISLLENHPEKAPPLLNPAIEYFSSKGMKESEWKSWLVSARAAKALGNSVKCSRDSRKALDILRDLEQSWGSAVYSQYSSRSDNRNGIRELSRIR